MRKTKKAFTLLLWFAAFNLKVIAQPVAQDSLLKPGNDFYKYINEGWLKSTKIPDDMPSIGGFATLALENQQKLKNILEELASKTNLDHGSIEQKVGDLYASGMDTETLNKLGYTPLVPMLNRIDAVRDYQELLRLIAQLYSEGNGQLLGFNVQPDLKNSKINIVNFSQAGITLPEKSYYTNNDPSSKYILSKLQQFIAKMFVLTGSNDADANNKAVRIVELETKIAASHLSNVDLRDPSNNYHKLSVADFQKLTPHINWNQLFHIMGVVTDSINIAHPAYFKKLDSLLATIPVETWKDKIKYVYINSKASLLSKAFVDANFAFNQVFSGQLTQPERWKTMVAMSDGELLGELYVKKYFSPEAKAKMDSLINNLITAFKIRLQKLDWMSDSTKKEALNKLSRITKKIGYPDKIRNYDDVEINRRDLFGNNESYLVHAFRESLSKINKAVDRSEWEMTAPTVNAYYNPTYNEIVFPAGILQPPFFDLHADNATNYGAIGMVISHEITHGFDDQGRQFDANGDLRDWWTGDDEKKFAERAQQLVTQYSKFKVLDTLPVNGLLTIGENIADQGGIAIAYDAFNMTRQGKTKKTANGMTPDQEFFKSFATIWRSKARDSYTAMLVKLDTHSPDKFRVNGTLSNFEPFYRFVPISNRDLMFRKESERVQIW